MKKSQKYLICLFVSICAAAGIIFLVQKQSERSYSSNLEWLAMWKNRSDVGSAAFIRDFQREIKNSYPVGSFSKKVIFDCQEHNLKIMNDIKSTQGVGEPPSNYNICLLPSLHEGETGGFKAYIIWCEDAGKITWVNGLVQLWIQ